MKQRITEYSHFTDIDFLSESKARAGRVYRVRVDRLTGRIDHTRPCAAWSFSPAPKSCKHTAAAAALVPGPVGKRAPALSLEEEMQLFARLA